MLEVLCLHLTFHDGSVPSIYLLLTFSIVAIDTVSPQGLRKSSLADGPLGGQWHVNITWTPDESQFGPNIFCYTAKDDMG